MKLAALLFGHALHHLDHLAPLCHFLKIPLLVTDSAIQETAEFFYPGIAVQELTPLELSCHLVKTYDGVISCLSRDLLDPLLLVAEEIYQKKLISIWCPHGNSDKGHLAPLMEGLHRERLILVYGQKMIDFIKAKNGKISPHLIVGNYRYHHYLHFKPFYDLWISKNLPPHRTLFYAPTWDDAEKSSSLKVALPFLNEQTFVKLHPNTALEAPHLIEKLIGDHQELHFIPTYAPIYPLLEHSQAYIGDMSSIGYDYLTFNRPLFFFTPRKRTDVDKGLYLQRCGERMPAPLTNQQEDLREIRQSVYEYTFSEVDPKTLLKKLHEACCTHFR